MVNPMKLNNIMISKEDYMAQKPYWDYQRKVEYNREKVLKGCLNIIKHFGETEDGFQLEQGELFNRLWDEITPADYEEPDTNWVPAKPELRIEGEIFNS